MLTPSRLRRCARTLVCVVGQLRATHRTWQGFSRHVLDTLGADLVVCADPPEAGEAACPYRTHACAQFDAAVPARLDEAFDRAQQELAAGAAGMPDWRVGLQRGGAWCGGLPGRAGAGGISIFKRWVLMQRLREAGLLDAYDRFVVTRSDYLWLFPHPPVDRMHPACIWVPDGEDWGGVNDRHAVLSRENIEHYLDLLSPLLTALDFIRPRTHDSRDWNMESYLWECLRQQGVDTLVRRFPYVMFLVREPDGPTMHSHGAWDTDLQCFVKSRTEQWTSECVAHLLQMAGGWPSVMRDAIHETDIEVEAEICGVRSPHRLLPAAIDSRPHPGEPVLIPSGVHVKIKAGSAIPFPAVEASGTLQGLRTPLLFMFPGSLERRHLRYHPVYRLFCGTQAVSWNPVGQLQMQGAGRDRFRAVFSRILSALTGICDRDVFAFTPVAW